MGKWASWWRSALTHSFFQVVFMLHWPVIPVVDSRTRWWWTALGLECWASTRRLSLRGEDETELGLNSQLTGDFLSLRTYLFQGSWARWFPACSVWGSEAPPHISAGRVSAKHTHMNRKHTYILPACSSNKRKTLNKIQDRKKVFLFSAVTMCVSWRTGRQEVERHTPWSDPNCRRSSQGCSRRRSRESSPRPLLSSFGT